MSTAAVLIPRNSGNSDVDQEFFSQQLHRGMAIGNNDTIVVPISPVQVGPATFVIGFARGSRDAQVPGLHRHAGSRPPMFLVSDNSIDTEVAQAVRPAAGHNRIVPGAVALNLSPGRDGQDLWRRPLKAPARPGSPGYPHPPSPRQV
jgi:hypothetical protein